MILDNLKGQMDKLEELLPGIERYLCETLANEKLSSEAEELRQYFVERLDILKLPPSRPPRTSLSHLKDEPIKKCPSSPKEDDTLIEDTNEDSPSRGTKGVDFAAMQRELSRTLLTKSSDESDDEWTSLCRRTRLFLPFLQKGEGKVYDDINDKDSVSDEEPQVYEVPITSASTDDMGPNSSIFDFQPDSSDYPDSTTDTTLTDSQSRPSIPMIDVVNIALPLQSGAPPPPLPPRHHRHSSGDTTHSTSTIHPPSLVIHVDEPPKLPARPNLQPRSEIYALAGRSDKSEKSDKSERSECATDEASDASHVKVKHNAPHVKVKHNETSYESYEDETGGVSQDSGDLLTKLNIKLPMPLKRKKKKGLGFSKSHSSSQWDLTLSFRDLEEVSICGELNIHGKLTWNRRLIAVTNRRLLCYKPEKMSKPSLVVQLSGYQATYHERESRKGFEILLHHPLAENYIFSVDLLEWAQSWCEYIQAACDGKDPPGRALRLYRHSGSYLTDLLYRTKSDPRSASSTSIASSDGSSASRKDYRDKSNRISLAQRASTLFIRKRGPKKMTVIGIPAEVLYEARPRPMTLVRTTGSLERPVKALPKSPSTPTTASGNLLKNSVVILEGYLHIFSSFNRKRIGKRWCLIRGNHFECYPNEKSAVCEMNFPLKDCTFRHAKDETGSDKAIMILENKAEKIVVEALLFDSLDDWINALLRETQTNKVPEGLDRYYTEKAYEVPPEDLVGAVDDPDDPYTCIKDLSLSQTEAEIVKTSEIKDKTEPSDSSHITDMYSPVLWENKRNSSRTSFKSEKRNRSRSSVKSDQGQKHVSDQGNQSQDSTPDGQTNKTLHSAAVTDSGYTTATSPTSANLQSLEEARGLSSEDKVTSPVDKNPLQPLLKSWDVKAKIHNLETIKKDSKSHSKSTNLLKTAEACVKSKVFSFEQKSGNKTDSFDQKSGNRTDSTTPTPPKRKKSQSKNKSVPKTTPKILKPVSLNFTCPSATNYSAEALKDIKVELDVSHTDLHKKELSEREVNCVDPKNNEKTLGPHKEDGVTSPCDTDSYVTSPCDTDSCVTDSSYSALSSEHETPRNSDTESLCSSNVDEPEYTNTPDKSHPKIPDNCPSKDLGDNHSSREGTVERLSSRESSTEPTTSCSSWDSSQEANLYNFGYDSSSDTNHDESEDIFFLETSKLLPSLETNNQSLSSENGDGSDVTLLSNTVLAEESLETGGHLENSSDSVFIEDTEGDSHDWSKQLITLRRKLVELKKNRIQVRDKKLRARSDQELSQIEAQFTDLDDACRETNSRISRLEGQIKLTKGEELTLSSNA